MIVAATALGAVSSAVFPTVVSSQTDFNIQADSADLKAEFQKELDKWMLRAYEGDRDAQFKVGVLFANDQFGPPDHEQSAYWYRQAARQGHPLAQYNLGHQFLMGNGVKRDERAAMQWWLKAAEQQHALAQFNVGRAYYLGIGLKKDLNQARFWFERASQNNEPKSTELLKQLGWWNPEPEDNLEQQVTSTASSNDRQESQGSQGSNSSGFTSKIEPIKEIPSDVSATPERQNEVVVDVELDTSNQPDKWVTTQNANLKSINPDQNKIEVQDPPKDTTADSQDQATAAPNLSIAVFTNPAVRSVLITILDDVSSITTIERGNRWTMITSSRGFPVWVSSNFVRVNGDRGVISATSVNARSVPLVTQGSVVGRFNRGEKVEILDSRNNWYRVYSPERFRGWVKTEDFEKVQQTIAKMSPPPSRETNEVGDQNSASTTSGISQTNSTEGRGSQTIERNPNNLSLGTGQSVDDNEWLFAQNQDHYTLQLASFSDFGSVNRFLNTLPFKDSNQLRLYNSRSNNDVQWTYITYGAYTDKERARNESERLGQGRAWIRRLGILQDKRCLAWKKQVPAPSELNQFCI